MEKPNLSEEELALLETLVNAPAAIPFPMKFVFKKISSGTKVSKYGTGLFGLTLGGYLLALTQTDDDLRLHPQVVAEGVHAMSTSPSDGSLAWITDYKENSGGTLNLLSASGNLATQSNSAVSLIAIDTYDSLVGISASGGEIIHMDTKVNNAGEIISEWQQLEYWSGGWVDISVAADHDIWGIKDNGKIAWADSYTKAPFFPAEQPSLVTARAMAIDDNKTQAAVVMADGAAGILTHEGSDGDYYFGAIREGNNIDATSGPEGEWCIDESGGLWKSSSTGEVLLSGYIGTGEQFLGVNDQVVTWSKPAQWIVKAVASFVDAGGFNNYYVTISTYYDNDDDRVLGYISNIESEKETVVNPTMNFYMNSIPDNIYQMIVIKGDVGGSDGFSAMLIDTETGMMLSANAGDGNLTAGNHVAVDDQLFKFYKFS